MVEETESERAGSSWPMESLWRLCTSVRETVRWSLPRHLPHSASRVPRDTYRILRVFPHDPGASTQGLCFADGFLYESTGLRGRSSLRKVELETGRVVLQRSLPVHLFGEGLTIVDDTVVQLTWASRLGFVYSLRTFELLRQIRYSTQGWGLTHDRRSFIMSDGSATLYRRDFRTFEEVGRIRVTDGDRPLKGLNDLQCVGGEIWANVYKTNLLVRVKPDSSRVVGWVSLNGLPEIARTRGRPGVLNGLAYDAGGRRLFVTGKRWPRLFEIEVVSPDGPTQGANR